MNRPPRSVAELEAMPPRGTTEWEVHVRVRADDFAPETLVSLLRETASSGNTGLFERCALSLVGRPGLHGGWVSGHCEPIIRSVGRALHDKQALDDFRQKCYEAMFTAIRAGRAKKPFWEERFGRALKQLCIDVLRFVNRGLDHFEQAVNRVDPAAMEVETDYSISPDEGLFQQVIEEDLRAAILRLPRRQAWAAYLAWIEVRSIESEDDGSVKNIMGVTARAVYKLLGEARQRLAADPQIRKYLEKH